MAFDHFEKRQLKPGQVDWNFNVVFAGDEAVEKMVEAYKPFLTHPGLHEPIPPKWLHTTVLRLGTTEEVNEAEALAVAEIVQARVNELQLPVFSFDSWWMLFGNVVFHISPDDEFTKLYDIVSAAFSEVVGAERAAKTPHGRYLAHATFAYTKTHRQEHEIINQLREANIQPASFRITQMPLIRQWDSDGHYEWEVVKAVTVP